MTDPHELLVLYLAVGLLVAAGIGRASLMRGTLGGYDGFELACFA